MPAHERLPALTGPQAELTFAETLHLLEHGTITPVGRVADASNVTVFGTVELDGLRRDCVYKPVAGEKPLWDFPDGTLAGREVAAYLVSEALGWALVPPTLLREGPLGPGMCQLWVETEDAPCVGFFTEGEVPQGWHAIVDAVDENDVQVTLAHSEDPALRRIAVLDAVLNNSDRKGSHVLSLTGGGLVGIDHGVSFHTEPKLRTVLWGWAGEPLPADALAALGAVRTDLDGDLGARLAELLPAADLEATVARVDALRSAEVHPLPSPGWPPLPWPPI